MFNKGNLLLSRSRKTDPGWVAHTWRVSSPPPLKRLTAWRRSLGASPGFSGRAWWRRGCMPGPQTSESAAGEWASCLVVSKRGKQVKHLCSTLISMVFFCLSERVLQPASREPITKTVPQTPTHSLEGAGMFWAEDTVDSVIEVYRTCAPLQSNIQIVLYESTLDSVARFHSTKLLSHKMFQFWELFSGALPHKESDS